VNPKDQLAFVQFDIGRFRDLPISESALINLDRILRFFRSHRQEVILRVVYDRIGKAIEKEPSFFSRVKEHIMQIGPVLEANATAIYTTQGVFVGNWGEMHGSKFLKQENLVELVHTFLDATSRTCFLAVRRPMQWRQIFKKDIYRETEDENVPDRIREHMTGLFDDGMLASESDLGTYGIKKRSDAVWREAWCRKDELDFQDNLCKHLPNGGEVVRGEYINSPKDVVAVFQKMHISYLNGTYDSKVLGSWDKITFGKTQPFKNVSLHRYIGEHMGYRFVLQKVQLKQKQSRMLLIDIENVGFANIHEDAWVYLLIRRLGGDERKIFLSTDVRMWNSQETITISKELPPLAQGQYQLYIGINRKKDGRIVQFANEGVQDTLYLGILTVRTDE
jgi:hypothetical protein